MLFILTLLTRYSIESFEQIALIDNWKYFIFVSLYSLLIIVQTILIFNFLLNLNCYYKCLPFVVCYSK